MLDVFVPEQLTLYSALVYGNRPDMANEGICLVKTCHVVITYLSPKCLKGIGKMEKKTFYPKTRIQTIMDKSPWDTYAIFIFF